MSGGGGGQGSHSKANSQNRSDPLTPGELSGYWNELNGITNGRLDQFAKGGAPRANYEAVTAEELRGMGGMGVTRSANAEQQRADSTARIGADPALDAAQKARSTQLVNDYFDTAGTAISSETRAAQAALLSEEQQKRYASEKATAEQALKEYFEYMKIFYGHKGERSSGFDNSISRGGGGSAG